MKEAAFVRQNKEKWKQYQESLRDISSQSPDTLADIYIDITNDLSFAQSHYPNSRIAYYLNNLSEKIHHYINRKKKEKLSRIAAFWKYEIPEIMYKSRKELLYSFLIFAISALIGVFSSMNDEGFSRLILGDYYVEMTLSNIADEDPMAVYKDSHKGSMFWGITINNIRVSFNAFIAGIFTSIATAYFLVVNGIMVGCFQYFFHEHGLLWDSFLTIWIHGTLEISAIIIAGAAGILMGNGWLFPKTYTRIESFKRSARKGAKIIIGTIPIFVIAGFLESFVTRLTDLPDFIRLSIILFSLAFVIFYYIIYPQKIYYESGNKN